MSITRKHNKKKPDHCIGCLSHWKHGVADGKHNNWCCHFGQPAKDIVNHCELMGEKREQT